MASTIVRDTLSAFHSLNSARATFNDARTPSNFFALLKAESAFKRANAALARAQVAAYPM